MPFSALCAFLTYQSCIFNLPLYFAVENKSVLRSKSSQKTRSSRKRSKRSSFFFLFLSLCSLRDVTAAVFVLVFSFLRKHSLSRLSLNFSSLSKESRSTCPTLNHRHYRRGVCSLCDNNTTHLLHTSRKKRERERRKKRRFCHGSSFKRRGGDAFKQPFVASERRRDATDHASRVL